MSFDPTNISVHNKNEWFSGWRNQYIRYDEITGAKAVTQIHPSRRDHLLHNIVYTSTWRWL